MILLQYISAGWRNDWRELMHVGHFNWINWSLLKIEFEYDKIGPQLELEFRAFGLGFYVVLALPWKTKQSEVLIGALKEVKELKRK